MSVSLTTQAATLRNLLRQANGHAFVRGGFVARTSQGDLVIEHLTAALKTIEALASQPKAGAS